MKNKLHSLLVLIASSAVSSAAIVSYPILNTTLTTQGGGAGDDLESVTTPISASPNHTWIDNDSGGPTFSPNVYFGGSITFAPDTNGGEWGSGVNYILRIGGSNVVTLKAGAGTNGWRFEGDSSGSTIAGYPRATSFDFVIKLEDTQWNTAVAKIFLGANANNATEGTADYTVNVTGRTTSPIDTILFDSYTANWTGASATSLATLNYAFSSTEWTPVSAVPEPSQYAAILAVLALAFGYIRKRNRK